jgi:hypothetical protein
VRLPRPEGAEGTDDEWQYVLSTCSAEEADFWVGKLQTHATAPMTTPVLSTLMHSRTAANLDTGMEDTPWVQPPWTVLSPADGDGDGAVVVAAGLQRVHEVHTAWRGVSALQAAAQLTQRVVQQDGRCLEQLMQRVKKRLGRENVAAAAGQLGPEEFLSRGAPSHVLKRRTCVTVGVCVCSLPWSSVGVAGALIDTSSALEVT